MNAYYLAMLYVCICAGIFIIGQVGAFGDIMEDTFTGGIFNWFAGTGIQGLIFAGLTGMGTIVAIGTAMYLANIKVLGNQPGSSQAVGLVVFSVVFWGSFLAAFDVTRTIATSIGGLAFFNVVFWAISILVFAGAMVQFSTGSGVKAHG